MGKSTYLQGDKAEGRKWVPALRDCQLRNRSPHRWITVSQCSCEVFCWCTSTTRCNKSASRYSTCSSPPSLACSPYLAILTPARSTSCAPIPGLLQLTVSMTNGRNPLQLFDHAEPASQQSEIRAKTIQRRKH